MGAARLCARREIRRAWRAHLALTVLVAVVGATVLAVTAGAHRTNTAFERFLTYSGVPDTFAVVGDDEAHLDQIGSRRRRDFGVLESIGFTSHQLRGALSWQGAALGLIGVAIGLPAGIIVGRLAWAATAGGLGVADDILIPADRLVAAGLVTLLLFATIGLIAGARVGRKRPTTALRAE